MRLQLKEKVNLLAISFLIIWVSFVSILSIFFIKGDIIKIKEAYSIKNIKSIVNILSIEMDDVTTSALNLENLYKNKELEYKDLLENNIDGFYVFNNNMVKQIIIPEEKDNLRSVNPYEYLIEARLRVGLTSINGMPAIVDFKNNNGGQVVIAIRLLNKQRLEKIYNNKDNEVIFSFLKPENKNSLYELKEVTEKNIKNLYILYDHKNTKVISDFIIKDYFEKDTIEIKYNFDRSVSQYISKSQSQYIILMVVVGIVLTFLFIYVLDTKLIVSIEKKQDESDEHCNNNLNDNSVERNIRNSEKKLSKYGKNTTNFQILNNTCLAMVSVKEREKNNCQFFKGYLKNEITVDMIENGIKNGEIEVYYQPKVNSFTNEIDGVEVLVRWFHPNLGYIPPVKLIKVAEDTGYISTLGKWILNKACSDLKELNEVCNTKIRVSVNISPIQFMEKEFVNELKEIMNRWQLNPIDLELEFTKDIENYNFAEVISKFEEINELGIGIIIDNFDAENSSFKHFQQYKVDTIKLDRNLVKELEKDDEIMKSIIEISHILGFKVVAKGVENFIQAQRLVQLSCDFFQGYFFYKPMPFNNLIDIIEKYKVII
jgi:EAL domain-containing protein (putative c-di-GMP-specific phosphodiesterase class I)